MPSTSMKTRSTLRCRTLMVSSPTTSALSW